jgi:peptide/nickel transport system permease protein
MIIFALSIGVPVLSPYDTQSSVGLPLEPPNLNHPFGVDHLGRDIFTRTFAAAQLDITVALLGVAIPLVIGTILGAIVGTTNNQIVIAIWTAIVDAINAFPLIVLVIAVVAALGPGVEGIIVALGMTNWARYGKIARTKALTLRNADFISAAQVLGYSQHRILFRHIVPNVYSETLAYGLSDFVLVIITVAGLSFLGMGVRPPTPEWGAMMSEGRLFLMTEWWITLLPGVVLSITAIGVALFAQGAVSIIRGEE